MLARNSAVPVGRSDPLPFGLVRRLSRADRMADLLIILLILYTGFVLTPVFQIADFDELELSTEVATSAGSNIVNQLFWFAGTAIGLLAIWPQARTRLGGLVMANPWLFALAVFGMISTLWALNPQIALRRSIQQGMVIFCIAAAVGGATSIERLLRMIYLGFALALVVHLIALPLPASYDWRHAFRGFFSDKNGLGALAAVAILWGGAIRGILQSKIARMANLAYLGAWLAILVLTLSKTSMALVIIVPAIYLALVLVSRSTKLGVGIYFVLLPLILGSLLSFVIFGVGIAPMELAAMISPDVTFTGRTNIWEFVLEALHNHWLLGYGFHSFWSIGADSPNLAAQEHFIRFLNQAHNGFLDLILSVGLVGLGLFTAAVVQGAASATRTYRTLPVVHRLCWTLIIFALIHNMSESSLLRGFSPQWLTLLFALLIAARASSEGGSRGAEPNNANQEYRA